MTDESHVEELLGEALERIESGEEHALDAVCRAHPEHAARLRSLAAKIGTIGLGTPAAEPDRLGPYRLLHRLGMGGMGVVHEAEHLELGRRVALKSIRPERLLTGSARERFWREARAVSQLDHPNICPVYEVGEANGAPFMAMRLCSGQTLQQRIAAADERESTGPVRDALQEFLEVAEKVARALHYAHQAGFVHRDVKPANIMLEPRGSSDIANGHREGVEPVVLDFGLARGESDAGLTVTGDAPGTPAYMSPEQIAPGRFGDDGPLDGRTDVYSLGVTLYEWLTTRPAFHGTTVREIHDAVLNQEPSPLRKLRPQLSRDLETVVAKAMGKDRRERYATAGELADELQRLRAYQPILASRPDAIHRLRRWNQRNPMAAAAVAILSVSLIAISALALWAENARADALAARDDLREEVAKVDAINHFLVKRVLGSEGLSPARMGQLTIADALERALVQVDRTTFVHPEVEAGVRQTIAQSLQSVGKFSAALEQIERALEIRGALLEPEDPSLISTRELYAQTLHALGRNEEAEVLAEELLGQAVRRHGEGSRRVEGLRTRLTRLRLETGRTGEGRAELEATLSTLLQRSVDDVEVVKDLQSVSTSLLDLGETRRAIEALERTLSSPTLRTDEGGSLAPGIHADLGFAHYLAGRHDEAERLLREALDLAEQYLSTEHSRYVSTQTKLGSVLAAEGRFDEAEQLFVASLARLDTDLADDHSRQAAIAHNSYGKMLRLQGRYAKGRHQYERSLEIRRRLYPDDHPKIAVVLNNLATLESNARPANLERARKLNREALEIRMRAFGAEHDQTILSVLSQVSILRRLSDIDGLRSLEQECLGWYAPDGYVLGALRAPLAHVLRTRGRLVEAEAVARDAIEALLKHRPQGDDLARRAYFHASCSIVQRIGPDAREPLDPEDAIARLETLRVHCEQHLGPDDPALATTMLHLASVSGRDDRVAAGALVDRAERILRAAGAEAWRMGILKTVRAQLK